MAQTAGGGGDHMKRLLIFFWNLLRPRRDSDDERLRAVSCVPVEELQSCEVGANGRNGQDRSLQEVEG